MRTICHRSSYVMTPSPAQISSSISPSASNPNNQNVKSFEHEGHDVVDKENDIRENIQLQEKWDTNSQHSSIPMKSLR